MQFAGMAFEMDIDLAKHSQTKGVTELAHTILAVNPGSTSTKVMVIKNQEAVLRETIYHPHEEIEKYPSIIGQVPMRKDVIEAMLEKSGITITELSAVVGCGGLLPPVGTGGYVVNKRMLDMIESEEIPAHASNLGAVIAHAIAAPLGKPAYIYDAVSAGILPAKAKITGFKEIERRSLHHVLNSRAMARKYAEGIGKKLSELNLVVAHLGGGISGGAYAGGELVDSFADDNGPFAPQRSGGVPLMDFIELCFGGQFTKADMRKKVRGMGGLRALLGTSDGMEVAKMVDAGDERATLVMDALAYQVAKGAMGLLPALYGNCDAVILTGGLAYNQQLVSDIVKYIGKNLPVSVMPGEAEMEALAYGALRILRGEEEALEF